MSKIQRMTSELNQILHSDTYQFEIDTEDFVFGFKSTIKKRTKDLAKALKLEQKVTKDCGPNRDKSQRGTTDNTDRADAKHW